MLYQEFSSCQPGVCVVAGCGKTPKPSQQMSSINVLTIIPYLHPDEPASSASTIRALSPFSSQPTCPAVTFGIAPAAGVKPSTLASSAHGRTRSVVKGWLSCNNAQTRPIFGRLEG